MSKDLFRPIKYITKICGAQMIYNGQGIKDPDIRYRRLDTVKKTQGLNQCLMSGQIAKTKFTYYVFFLLTL